ncbi:MAG: hypothetical protein HQM11_05650 [SAR324 cluster bacterium]|nr:hypothetical protein [SAR324 cluster bacterium]
MRNVSILKTLGVFLLLFILPGSFPHAEEIEKVYDVSWLKISPGVGENYEIEIPPEDVSRMNIYPKWKKSDKELSKKILGLVPKDSSSYSLASTKLLELLKIEGIHAQVTIMYWGKEEIHGKQALAIAEKEGFDLIFSMGSESADFVHEFYKGGKLPVVTSTNKDPVPLGQMADYENGSGTNIAMTSLNVPLKIQMSYLFELKPDLKNIGLMYDQNHVQVMATEVVPAIKVMKDAGLNVIDVTVQNAATSRETLQQAIPEAIRTMQVNDPELNNSIFWITSSTAVFDELDTIAEYSGKVPVLATIPNAVKNGEKSAVIAIGIDRRNNAHLASIYAIRILRGEVKPGDLKVGVVTPPDVAINFRVAQKIGLKIPFSFFENAAFIYDYEGRVVRDFGEKVVYSK